MMLDFLRDILRKKFTPLNLITINKQRLIDNYRALSGYKGGAGFEI